jgi:hypothetical protein
MRDVKVAVLRDGKSGQRPYGPDQTQNLSHSGRILRQLQKTKTLARSS